MELDQDENDRPPDNEQNSEEQQQQQQSTDEQQQDPPEGPVVAEIPQQPQAPVSGVHPGSIAVARQRSAQDIERTRSPTPPRALYRSTTGKGVAFTDEDVIFLVRFLEYRKRQQDGKPDMVAVWKDVAAKVCCSPG